MARPVSRAQFYRLALLPPLIIPVIGFLLLALQRALTAGLPDWLLALSIYVVAAAAIYAIPYVPTFIYLYRRIPDWSASRLTAALWVTPGVLALWAPMMLALMQILGGAEYWWDGCLTIAGVALAVGYCYAAIIWAFWIVRVRGLSSAA